MCPNLDLAALENSSKWEYKQVHAWMLGPRVPEKLLVLKKQKNKNVFIIKTNLKSVE